MSESGERHGRTQLLIGRGGMETLERASVLVFGVGGVGGYICEALARAGVGHIAIVDNDAVSESNINRQIIATYDTIGQAEDGSHAGADPVGPAVLPGGGIRLLLSAWGAFGGAVRLCRLRLCG